MVKRFTGQVKIADVQAAFDEIVNHVNYLVDSYNRQAFVKDIDYTVGGTTLAPAGYTLTVGGFKQFLNACDGCVVGCNPIRTDETHFKLTTGILIAKSGIYKLPDSVHKIPTDKSSRILYYNTTSKKYTWTPAEENVTYRVCDINPECSSDYIGTIHDVTLENINGTLNIYSQDRDYTTPENYIRVQKDSGTSCYNALDTSKAAKFVSALTADVSSNNSGGNDISLFGTKVCHVGYQGGGRGEYYFPMTFLYVPKGVSNPYTYYDSWRETTNPNASCQKVLNVIIDKNIEDKSG